jgi:hypothetical protein
VSSTAAEARPGYQGWRNYETWAVALWIDNEITNFHYWREIARNCQRDAPNTEQVKKGIWTPKEAAKFNLADQLKEKITEGHPVERAEHVRRLAKRRIQRSRLARNRRKHPSGTGVKLGGEEADAASHPRPLPDGEGGATKEKTT